MEESVVLTPEDFPGSIGATYPRIFHNLDVCKDAEQARVSVTLTHTPGGTTLFENATKALGFKSCKGYKGALEKLEDSIQKKIDSDKDVIQKQINRLDKPSMSSREVKNTGIPLSIKLAIRDSGASADSYREDIGFLEVPSDYSDPATRTPLQGRAPRFPPTGQSFQIGADVFSMMLGKDIIQDFTAVMSEDNSCVISFSIAYPYMGQLREFAYATEVGANYTSRKAVAGANNASDFFQGNPEKNTYFNQNQSAWVIRKSPLEQATVLGDAICYLISKEFFGDVLIALIARKYKVAGSPEGAAAVFTSDNALKSLCALLQVDYVAKNWKPAATEEAVACLFSADPVAELEAGKAKIIEDTMAWNERLGAEISAYIVDGNEFKGIGPITRAQIEFFRQYFLPYVAAINAYIRTVSIKDARSLVEFRVDIERYQVKNILKEVKGDTITMYRGVYNPFKYVPATVAAPEGFPEINTEFLVFLQKFKGDRGAGAQGRVQLGKRRMQGGASAERIASAKRLEASTDANPTEALKGVIKRVLAGFELDDVHGKVDVNDIYNYLYGIYNIDCIVSFNDIVVGHLIDGFLQGLVQLMSFQDARTLYNKLLESENNVATLKQMKEEEDAEAAEAAAEAKYEPTERAIVEQYMAATGKSAATKSVKRPTATAKRTTVKQRMYSSLRKKESAKSTQLRKNRSQTKKRRALKGIAEEVNGEMDSVGSDTGSPRRDSAMYTPPKMPV